jgi:lipopolysaccharide/colanic/teichoic acid biosynthesis glycosyltransferase
LSTNRSDGKNYLSFGKRIFDLALTFPALIILSPVMILTALIVRIRMDSPILFKQVRPGLQERPFTILKFRTMMNQTDENGKMLSDDKRLTPLGAILRKTSIDELPELINVIKGEMSIVGPRPLFMEYLPYYTEREHLRHTVRPGVTGLSQISGRNYLPWDERLEMDVKYVENISFIGDVKIIFKTFFQVLKAKDVAVISRTVSVSLSECRKEKVEENKLIDSITLTRATNGSCQ